MRLFKNRAAVGLLVLGSLIPLTFAGNIVAAGPSTVGLGTADSYGVLAGDTITNTGATTIRGDLGLYPGTSVTGSPTVTGQSNVNNGAAQNAKADLRTAYLDAAGRTGASLIAAGALGGRTLAPGLYKDDGAPASLAIATGQTLTLAGDASSVWIFQSASTLTADTGSRVVLTGGAQACNVFWQVGTSATFNAGAVFVGTVMAHVSISVGNSVTVDGRLLAGAQANGAGALTMDTDTISKPTCAALPQVESTPADVGVTKTASPTTATVGDNVTYTSVVTNNGPGVATGVAFEDTLPAGESFVSVATTQGSCGGTSTVTCALGTLSVGQTATVTIVVRTTAAGTHANTARISAQQADQNVGANNTSTATVAVAPVATPTPPAATPTPPSTPSAAVKAAAAKKAAAVKKAAAMKKAAAVKKAAAARRAAAAGSSTSVSGPALPPVNPAGFTG
jgi:type VI secretion system secreted protein VgrG